MKLRIANSVAAAAVLALTANVVGRPAPIAQPLRPQLSPRPTRKRV